MNNTAARTYTQTFQGHTVTTTQVGYAKFTAHCDTCSQTLTSSSKGVKETHVSLLIVNHARA